MRTPALRCGVLSASPALAENRSPDRYAAQQRIELFECERKNSPREACARERERDSSESFWFSSRMQKFLFLLVAIVAEVIGTTALRASEGFTRIIPSIVVVIGYGVSFYFLSLTLKYIPVGIAYAIWSGLGIVLISTAAWILYGQKLDLAAMLGMALIVAGVLVINLLSKSATH